MFIDNENLRNIVHRKRSRYDVEVPDCLYSFAVICKNGTKLTIKTVNNNIKREQK